MAQFASDQLRFVVGHEGGVSDADIAACLRIEATGDPERWLAFTCWTDPARSHWETASGDRKPTPPGVDALEWMLGELKQDLAGWLGRAGLETGAAAALPDGVEAALRNPPVDFDAVGPDARAPSYGEKWTTYPPDVVPVWVADMDFPVAEPIRRVLRRSVARSDLGYPIHPAPTPVPDLTVARMRDRYGWAIEPRNVEVLSDVVQGMYVALEQCSEPGEGVVVQTPIYPPFLGSVRKTRRRLVENPLVRGPEGYGFDLDHLRRVADAGTRMLLLCNPHNPTGRVFRREELEALAEVVLERDWIVVSDEIHQDLVYEGHHHVPFASLGPEVAARTITLTAASKAFNVAGLRCALAIFGDEKLRQRFNGLPRHLRGGVGILGIESLRAAWEHGEPWLEAARAYLEANRRFTLDFVARAFPDVVVHPPEATYLAWLDFRSMQLEPSPYAVFLEKGRVALSDGLAFGEEGRGFARINFATSRRVLTEALERMVKALQ
ncbi:MAG: MalY/PatB family protein [Myxococcota bacterium]